MDKLLIVRSLTRLFGTFLLIALVSGCDELLSESPAPALPGKRISILSADQSLQLKVNSSKRDPIKLPPPEPNDEWPQAGGSANHAMHHMQIADNIDEVWSTNVGDGTTNRSKLLSQPIIAEGRIFTIDTANVITALSEKSGRELWQVDIMPEDVLPSSSGGIAYDDGKLFVSTGFAQLVSLDAKTGKVLWRESLSGPMRGAPTVRAGRVIVVTVDDHTYCLAADDGQVLWTHQGTIEPASLLAGNSVAIDGNVVVVPYASGELFALRIESGAVIWQDSIANISKVQGVATLTDITGRPIIDRGRVYVSGHADVVTAIDLRTGKRLWDKDIGSTQSIWVAGDYLYMITNSNELVALEGKTGAVLWVTQLETWQNPEKKKDRIVWAGPVLASNRLIIGSNTGILASVSPYTGEIMGQVELGDGITIAPVVANDGLYILTDGADVVAYR